MNEVFEKTRELGEALLNSEEFKAVKTAENIAMGDKEAAEVVGRYIELKSQMETLMSSAEKDWGEVQRVTYEINDCKEKMDSIDSLIALDRARDAFSELINQVNNVLRFIVTGEMAQEESGCTGSCSTCGGCSSKVN